MRRILVLFNGVHTEAQFKLDPTQPGTFQKWQREGHCVGGFISVPVAKIIRRVFHISSAYNGQSYLFLCS